MANLVEIEKLVEKKESCFMQYEKITDKMLHCPAEELEMYSIKRNKLIEKINGIEQDILEIAREQGIEAVLLNTLRLRCNRDELSEEYFPLFDRAMNIFAVANRVQQKDPEILDRINREMDDLMEKIKQNNRSIRAQAAKFGAAQTNTSMLRGWKA